ARLLKENGLHFSLKSFFVKNSVGYPIRKPQKRYFAGLSLPVSFLFTILHWTHGHLHYKLLYTLINSIITIISIGFTYE
ncbi:hypothetical protein, partial [Brevibacillus borstelensis]|uniref:hypothetical protein n=1 Tax=Brevibacillus borstelensis TaxID=45462 RepID=UPI002E1EA6B1|nr:hypothetical protein [Brevibacillus borstelensis]